MAIGMGELGLLAVLALVCGGLMIAVLVTAVYFIRRDRER